MAGRISKALFISLVCLLAACANRSVNSEHTTCVFPDSPRYPAPAFVCNPDIPGFPLTELRSSPKSDAPVSERIDHIYHDQVSVWVNTWSQQWYRDAELQQQAAEFLFEFVHDRARVVRSRVSPKDTLWLLVALPFTEAELQRLAYDEVAPADPDDSL